MKSHRMPLVSLGAALLFSGMTHSITAVAEPGHFTADSLEFRPVAVEAGTDAEPTHIERPMYSMPAARKGLEGWVRLRFHIEETGKPGPMDIYDSSGSTKHHRALEKNAQSALKRWRWKPATLDGQAVVQQDLTQVMVFSLQPSSPPSDYFRGFFQRTLSALNAGDVELARVELSGLDRTELITLSELGLTAMLEAMLALEDGDDERAMERADEAYQTLKDRWQPAAQSQVLGMLINLNVRANKLHKALEFHEELLELETDLAEEDPSHAAAVTAREILADPQPIVTDGAIAPCELCLSGAHQFTRRLNRQTFTVRVFEGQAEAIRISCPPAYTTVDWEEDVAWHIENPPEDCSITVTGEPDSKVQLVELAAGP